jgi:hypothetical protein
MPDDIRIKEVQNERREYFRVNDVLPLITKKIESMAGKKSRVLSGYFAGLGTANFVGDSVDATVNPKVWKMLCDINAKLDLILDRLFGNNDETANAESKEVSLSVSGISFTTKEKFDLGDLIEVRMYLPIHPPIWVIVYGNVVRSSEVNEEHHAVGIQFMEMENEVRDVVSYYTIKRQREIIMKQKRHDI